MAESDSMLGDIEAWKHALIVRKWPKLLAFRRSDDSRDSMASGAIRHISVDVVLEPLSRVLTKLGGLLTGEYKLGGLISELETVKGALQKLSNTPPYQLGCQDKIWARELREGSVLQYRAQYSCQKKNIEDSIYDFVFGSQFDKFPELRGIEKYADRRVRLLEHTNKIAIRFLQSELKSIQAVLEKLSSKPADRIQARHVRELSHDIADNIVTFMAYSEGNVSSNLRGIKECIDRSVRLLDYTKNIATKIKDINSCVTGMHGPHRSYDVNLGAVGLYKQMKDLDGIDERRDELIKILLEETGAPMQKFGKIASIVGYGGLGKTTLANVVRLMSVLRSFKGLCLLHLENCDLSQGYSLNELGKLFHLRYLGLRGTRIAQLPEEIKNIQSLQVLDVRHNNISRLPSTVIQLRRLIYLYTDKSTRVPNGIGKLTSLQELSTLRIDDSTMCLIEELGQLRELRVLDIVLFSKWNSKFVEYLSKLQKIKILGVKVNISEGDLEEVEAALRHATEVHPNRPTLRIGITKKRDSKSRVKEMHKKHEYRYKIDSAVAEPVTATVFPCLFTQYMKVPNLVGHEEAVNELMKILTETTEMSLAHGKIISIVGLGGLGKTTFAHAIYRKLRAQFDCWAFVSISQNPDIKKLLKCMLCQLGKKNYANIHDGILDDRQLIYELMNFFKRGGTSLLLMTYVIS